MAGLRNSCPIAETLSEVRLTSEDLDFDLILAAFADIFLYEAPSLLEMMKHISRHLFFSRDAAKINRPRRHIIVSLIRCDYAILLFRLETDAFLI